ncbi:transmembrane protein 154 isoform X1 [Austrofundulus limnaeus]|uniref:Transmembrane protein 154 isoform X1 n=2 Tax=Austrofundulus limnaeus TaxID=52670 RepID=A0A2I4C820_AUSLI|nr:PREDICTED: transmembrane protein 154 isoform X1 [Austrofundulus limnaeus]
MSLLSNMRGPRLKTPLLLLLLLLLSSLTEKAFSQDGEEDDDTESTQEPEETETELPVTQQQVDNTMETQPTSASSLLDLDQMEGTADSGSGSSADVEYVNSTDLAEEEKELDLLTILIPAILGVVLLVAIVCGTVIIKRQCSKNSTSQEQSKEDPYLDGSSTEKVPMPMFEEDVPSVLELEMDELDKWMQKDF